MCYLGRDVFFFKDTATPVVYTLSLHDALPIFTFGYGAEGPDRLPGPVILKNLSIRIEPGQTVALCGPSGSGKSTRSEEHTSELQSQSNLVCRLLLEKKKTTRSLDPRKRS